MLRFPNAFALRNRISGCAVLLQCISEMIAFRSADNNGFLWNRQILLQPIRMVLKVTLASFVENKKVCAGKITVVRQYKKCVITVANGIQNLIFPILDVGSTQIVLKALVLTVSAWMDGKFGKSICFYRLVQKMLDADADLIAISTGS